MGQAFEVIHFITFHTFHNMKYGELNVKCQFKFKIREILTEI